MLQLSCVGSGNQSPCYLAEQQCFAGYGQYALDLAVRDLVQTGLPVIVAAGNDDTNACDQSPARCRPLNLRISDFKQSFSEELGASCEHHVMDTRHSVYQQRAACPNVLGAGGPQLPA